MRWPLLLIGLLLTACQKPAPAATEVKPEIVGTAEGGQKIERLSLGKVPPGDSPYFTLEGGTYVAVLKDLPGGCFGSLALMRYESKDVVEEFTWNVQTTQLTVKDLKPGTYYFNSITQDGCTPRLELTTQS
ncbi:hypothetical protein LAJ19_03050 [Deinococcus taeanensis]|uniref:hypothetical protein n=1 Tax=Deinococcus taeanensis TaxID=2737050 RepID=UPI001CDBD112|nr:hypothetical protein [Deinococcus taeanensis]UBV43211.1 hypothetical protein LAJ19_03050 [Deinococcus taeanensis]